MRKIGILSSMIFAVVIASPLSVCAGVTNGEPAPDFTLEATSGDNVSLSEYKGKYVVLEWLNHDCPFVKKHYDSRNMQNLQKTYTDKGVVWLSVNSSAHDKQGHYHPQEANQLTKDKGANPTAVLMDFDGVVGRMYEAKTTPHMYVINPAGILIYQGAIDDIASASASDVAKATNLMKQALDEGMNGNEVSVAATKSYGCSVKY